MDSICIDQASLVSKEFQSKTAPEPLLQIVNIYNIEGAIWYHYFNSNPEDRNLTFCGRLQFQFELFLFQSLHKIVQCISDLWLWYSHVGNTKLKLNYFSTSPFKLDFLSPTCLSLVYSSSRPHVNMYGNPLLTPEAHFRWSHTPPRERLSLFYWHSLVWYFFNSSHHFWHFW